MRGQDAVNSHRSAGYRRGWFIAKHLDRSILALEIGGAEVEGAFTGARGSTEFLNSSQSQQREPLMLHPPPPPKGIVRDHDQEQEGKWLPQFHLPKENQPPLKGSTSCAPRILITADKAEKPGSGLWQWLCSFTCHSL